MKHPFQVHGLEVKEPHTWHDTSLPDIVVYLEQYGLGNKAKVSDHGIYGIIQGPGEVSLQWERAD